METVQAKLQECIEKHEFHSMERISVVLDTTKDATTLTTTPSTPIDHQTKLDQEMDEDMDLTGKSNNSSNNSKDSNNDDCISKIVNHDFPYSVHELRGENIDHTISKSSARKRKKHSYRPRLESRLLQHHQRWNTNNKTSGSNDDGITATSSTRPKPRYFCQF
jgi:hypothetical protein